MQTLGQLLDQLTINAIKVDHYRRQPQTPEMAERRAAAERQHAALTLECEAAHILILFGLRKHEPFRQLKSYGGQTQ